MPVESRLVPEVVGAAAGAPNRLADLVLAAHVKPEVLLALEHPVAELACELKHNAAAVLCWLAMCEQGGSVQVTSYSALCVFC